jgi:gamma-glutamyltranspeptidase
MGIGGGFFMTIYHNGVVQTLDAREVAPLRSSVDMFSGDPNKSQIG